MSKVKLSIPGANNWIKNVCCPIPTALDIIVKAESTLSSRELKARLYRLAAELECRSVDQEWIVNVGHVSHAGSDRRRMGVSLELAYDSEVEQHAAEELLAAVKMDINVGLFRF